MSEKFGGGGHLLMVNKKNCFESILSGIKLNTGGILMGYLAWAPSSPAHIAGSWCVLGGSVLDAEARHLAPTISTPACVGGTLPGAGMGVLYRCCGGCAGEMGFLPLRSR